MAQKKVSRISIKAAPRPMRKGLKALPALQESVKTLEVVLKCDSFGTVEAVMAVFAKLQKVPVEVKVIHAGVGEVSKSDLVMALTGSRLVLGFNVGVMPRLDQWAKEHGVEVRLYSVIYKLLEDIRHIAQSWVTKGEPEETIIGRAKVIALFKSTRGGIIVGCEVKEGMLVVGRSFRLISAMGPIYTGRIESLHIERDAVKEAKKGQQAGIKILGFDAAKVGDIVECYEKGQVDSAQPWRPSGTIIHLASR